MKYLIVMESSVLKPTEIKYKKNKCVAGWTTNKAIIHGFGGGADLFVVHRCSFR